ncbi:hypothetical protein N2K95_10525 [Arthrobacter zhaoxinii]|uniref:Tetratricopeptide repeat protein n=1 Tax=Arthrobacter zhaoxinii TaxID=2964616 RepID=A0ABY5YM02_9MICC|nr:hypothetical protein [Arthrobacter zhaoxinii]UWX96114.1 hypothetical protein N2K95_10525 [Arthrobacter zhaoxinii]
MFLHSCQSAKESLSDDDKFVALELGVLDDFISVPGQGDSRTPQNRHLEYLAALHFRGEGDLALELLERALALTSHESLPTDGATASTVQLLIFKAELLMAANSFPEAESTLQYAASFKSSPQTIADIAILHTRALVNSSRKPCALAVLAAACDSLTPETIPTELVSTLAALLVDQGDYEQAEGILRAHIHQLSEIQPVRQPDNAVLCRVQLASVLFEQGKYAETMDTLRQTDPGDTSAPQIFSDLSDYYAAACGAVSSGKLLSECLSASKFLSHTVDTDADSLQLFAAFNWLRSSETSKDAMLRGFRNSATVAIRPLGEIFHAKELSLQGNAYERLAKRDYAGAVAAFEQLEKLRTEASRGGTLMAVLDSKALAFSLVQAGHFGALDAVRRARRYSQLLLGLASANTLWAVLDEARVLLDRNKTAPAGALVRQALSRETLPSDAREVLLRLQLVLMEVNTRSGRVQESLKSAGSLASAAAGLRSTAPDLEFIVQYQAAAAKAAAGDFDTAEHEFDALRHALEGAANVPPELTLKATYGLARVMQHRGEYTHALSLLRPLADASSAMSKPLSLRIRRRIAACHMSLNEYSAAAHVYRSCADDLSNWAGDKDPDYLDLRLSQADCLMASGQYKPARKIYRTLWEILHKDYAGRDRFYIRAVMGNATCLRRLKDYSGAVLNYRRVHNLEARTEFMSQEETFELEKWLAWSLEMTGAQEDAAQHYTEAIHLLEELEAGRKDLLEDLRFRALCCIG